ncbi:hypothetical protein SAMD00019534_056630 [Acytostelium subglobosum LB1]|uniref:hypothetical protein n=1 Tax=Acytostelium subglobosum LB1 TaxID=1410327 RepID=UPI00064484F7|nr:hypothetical protein SAMD00019534_056630 [Acytostelium subglobosum LB1]GAM22488.1 hypothetical protein SAMD00019534_056630 [Acytostelium subglobosum LB1]|eukprot:XP_012754608.1 hypothetical protein SAMD00019534_056630 [Acytostelium subglobosum LB1]
MNAQQYILKEINLEYAQLKEVVQCILHCILFQRCLGTVKPKDASLDIVEFTYTKLDDPQTSKQVEEKSEELLSSIIKRKAKTAQVSVSFQEKRQKTTFFSSASEVCWEQWIISFQLVPSMDAKQLANQLKDTNYKIIEHVNQDKNIPPITAKDQNPFPFTITIAGAENAGVFDTFWNVLKPPPLLGGK